MPTTPSEPTSTEGFITAWYAQYLPGHDPTAAIRAAHAAVEQILTGPRAGGFVILEPGNGTRYRIVVTDLSLIDQPEAVEELSATLLLSLLNDQGGTASVFGRWMQTPDYVARRLNLPIGDAVPIAAFLSLLGARMSDR